MSFETDSEYDNIGGANFVQFDPTPYTPATTVVGGGGTSVLSAGNFSQTGKRLTLNVNIILTYSTAPTALSFTLPNSFTLSTLGQPCTAWNTGMGTIGAYGSPNSGTINLYSTTGDVPFSASGQSLYITCELLIN